MLIYPLPLPAKNCTYEYGFILELSMLLKKPLETLLRLKIFEKNESICEPNKKPKNVDIFTLITEGIILVY